MRGFARWLLPMPIGQQTRPVVAAVIAYCLALYVVEQFLQIKPQYNAAVGTFATSVILVLLLSIHLNAAHNRWWEGRTLWGSLVNASRNLCLKLRAFGGIPAAERAAAARAVAGFPHALRLHLRGDVRLHDVPGFEADPANPQRVPLYIAGLVQSALGRWHAGGAIDSVLVAVLDEHARTQMDVCGACERIRHTPLPLSLRALLRHGIVIYLIVTPLYVTGELNLWGVPVMAVVAYFLSGMEALSEDIEEPFGHGPDNLDLDAYCRTIDNSVKEILGLDR
jgi:putative membrane protein